MSTFKAINNDQELDARINSFIERKTKRFPDLAKVEANQERSSVFVKVQSNMSDWFHPTLRRAH